MLTGMAEIFLVSSFVNNCPESGQPDEVSDAPDANCEKTGTS